MFKRIVQLMLLAGSCWSLVTPALAASHAAATASPAQSPAASPLVSAQWLQQNLARQDLLLLDAQPTPAYMAQHIPGAVSVDLYATGGREVPNAVMQRRMRAWGVSPGKKIVVYDQGGTHTATWLYWELYYHGVPQSDLLLLDGGLARWKAAGGAVTKEATPPPAPGSFEVKLRREDSRVRLPEFLLATGDLVNNALVEALEPSYHYGQTKFFDRPGHVPGAVLLPAEDLYNADKTFKSPEELRRMVAHLGIKPEQKIHSHCGGGVAATVPWFALKFLLDYPRVTVYRESQLEWLRDERTLPFWTYAAPHTVRQMQWLNGWNSQNMRSFGVANLSVLDVRDSSAYAQGHVPFSLNVPASTFRAHLAQPEKLAELLGPAGVHATHEAVIVSEGGITKNAALAYLALERAGQHRVSILTDSVDEWGLKGMPLTKEPTVVGAKKHPFDPAIVPTAYAAKPRAGVLLADAAAVHASRGHFPKIFVASGAMPLAQPPELPAGAKLVHLPAAQLLNPDGTPKSAGDIWQAASKAGVTRYAEIVLVADDVGDAAINHVLFRMMGFADVKTWAR